MTARNTYATLAEYKSFVTSRGQSSSTDATDDAVIDSLLEQASRYIDDETGRTFAPFVQARLFDTPNERTLYVDDDLLEVISITNGTTALPSTEYTLCPANYSPAYGIRITDVSSYQWESNASNSFENAITVNGIWGYHDKYNRSGWRIGTVLSEDVDLTELEFDVSASTLFSAGQIVRINNELMTIASTASGKITVSERGDLGSTAATHLSVTTVYIWQPMRTCNVAVLEIASNAYNRRFGNTNSNTVTVTAAGVVLSPRDIPSMAQAFIINHREMT